jgi:HJR/Mrr/RecB family endonuclease
VVATKNGLRLGLQCKLYTGNVSNSAIQEAFGGKQHYGLDQVAVITTGVFTKSALALAESTGVLLVAYADIDKIDQRLNVK